MEMGVFLTIKKPSIVVSLSKTELNKLLKEFTYKSIRVLVSPNYLQVCHSIKKKGQTTTKFCVTDSKKQEITK